MVSKDKVQVHPRKKCVECDAITCNVAYDDDKGKWVMLCTDCEQAEREKDARIFGESAKTFIEFWCEDCTVKWSDVRRRNCLPLCPACGSDKGVMEDEGMSRVPKIKPVKEPDWSKLPCKQRGYSRDIRRSVPLHHLPEDVTEQKTRIPWTTWVALGSLAVLAVNFATVRHPAVDWAALATALCGLVGSVVNVRRRWIR